MDGRERRIEPGRPAPQRDGVVVAPPVVEQVAEVVRRPRVGRVLVDGPFEDGDLLEPGGRGVVGRGLRGPAGGDVEPPRHARGALRARPACSAAAARRPRRCRRPRRVAAHRWPRRAGPHGPRHGRYRARSGRRRAGARSAPSSSARSWLARTSSGSAASIARTTSRRLRWSGPAAQQGGLEAQCHRHRRGWWRGRGRAARGHRRVSPRADGGSRRGPLSAAAREGAVPAGLAEGVVGILGRPARRSVTPSR